MKSNESTAKLADSTVTLSLETATRGGGVFLGRGKTELAQKSSDPEVSHSNSLLSDIATCLEDAAITLEQVDLLACASGPGSFTGLRIGIATLKGLAASLNVPCIGVPTLHALAHAAGPSPATVALIPAGRGEVFAQMLSVSSDDEVTEIDRASHLSPTRLVEKYAEIANLIWASNGCETHGAVIKDYAAKHETPFREILNLPDNYSHEPGWTHVALKTELAAHVAALALKQFDSGKTCSPHSLGAIYVRPSDAELNQWR